MWESKLVSFESVISKASTYSTKKTHLELPYLLGGVTDITLAKALNLSSVFDNRSI